MRINQDRLMQSLESMWQYGETPNGGVTRLALTNEDKAARDLLAQWFADAGLELRVDDFGNMIGRRAGSEDLPPILLGSHLDTVPQGGRYDGVLGVMSALEVVRTLNDEGIVTRHPIDVINWTAEEGSRFLPSLYGSTGALGFRQDEHARNAPDANGAIFADELTRVGYAGSPEHRPSEAAAYLELHIEQGPVLEAEDLQVGVVLGIIGQSYKHVTVLGRAGHAGANPMNLRADALVVAAEMVLAVRDLALQGEGYTVATVGQMRVAPGALNVVPSRVEFTVDFRGALTADLLAIQQGLTALARELEARDGVTIEISGIEEQPETISFDARVLDSIRDAVRAEGLPVRDLWSGAGHDAHPASLLWPSGMIFVRSKDGLSHAEAEYSSPEDIAAGTNVLLRTVIELAGR